MTNKKSKPEPYPIFDLPMIDIGPPSISEWDRIFSDEKNKESFMGWIMNKTLPSPVGKDDFEAETLEVRKFLGGFLMLIGHKKDWP